jgi:hypothetical protein
MDANMQTMSASLANILKVTCANWAEASDGWQDPQRMPARRPR